MALTRLTRPRDIGHLTQQVQNLINELETSYGKKFAEKATEGGQIQAAPPVLPSDVVRLQDLDALRAEFLAALNAQNTAQTGSSAAGISILGNIAAPLYFVEAPDGIIPSTGLTDFTPDQPITTVGGRPVAVLNYKGRIYPWTSSASPEVGRWTYDSGTQQVKLNDADALEVGDTLEFAMAVLA